MEKGVRRVPEAAERLSVSRFTVIRLIKADEPKAHRMITRKAPVPSLKRRAWCRCCSVARGDSTHFFLRFRLSTAGSGVRQR
jgi:hypothetical protein